MSWSLRAVFDNRAYDASRGDPDRIDWLRVMPFILMHLAVITVLLVGWSWTAVIVCFASYFLRMFGITAFYHRLLSHRAFKCPRWVAAAGAFLGNASAQRGPLWWAAHHRHHHRHSDKAEDSHSPIMGTFLHSHVTWFLTRGNFATREDLVPDLADRWEMQFMDRFDWFAPLVWALGCFGVGWAVHALGWDPNTSGWQTFVWGFLIGTVVTWHCTFLVNSVAHLWGTRPYRTKDMSRNNPLIAIVTLGEGWHNNHHYYQASARQGFKWWQYDISYYLLRGMKTFGLISKLNPVPKRVLAKANNMPDKSKDAIPVEAIRISADGEPIPAEENNSDDVLPRLQESSLPDTVTPAGDTDGPISRSHTSTGETAIQRSS